MCVLGLCLCVGVLCAVYEMVCLLNVKICNVVGPEGAPFGGEYVKGLK